MQDLVVSTIINQLKSVRDQITQAVNHEMDDRMTRFDSATRNTRSTSLAGISCCGMKSLLEIIKGKGYRLMRRRHQKI